MSIARNLWYPLFLYIAGWQNKSPPQVHMCQLIMPCHQPKWQQTMLLVLQGGFPTPEQAVLGRKAAYSGLNIPLTCTSTWSPEQRNYNSSIISYSSQYNVTFLLLFLTELVNLCQKIEFGTGFSKDGKQNFLKSWNLIFFVMLNETEPIKAINKCHKQKIGVFQEKREREKESFSRVANYLKSQHSPEVRKIPFYSNLLDFYCNL